MKKLITIFLAATLSIGCLTACGNKTQEEKPAAETTTEVIQETAEEVATTEDNEAEELDAAFVAFLDGIYAAQPGTAGGTEKTKEAAEAFKEYITANGEATTAEAITYAATLYLNEKAAADEAYPANFKEAFAAVCDTLVDMDEEITTDTSYLKFVNGIDEAIKAVVGTSEEEEGDLSAEFTALLDTIAGGSKNTAEAAKAFKEYISANGEGTKPEAITNATSLYLTEKSAEDDAFLGNFEEAFAAICDTCFEEDESIEGDTNFLKFVDGIDAAIEEMFEE